MSKLAYLARGKTAEGDGVFGPIVIIDGIGDFPADQLDDVVSALIDLQREIRSATPDWLKAKGK